MDDDDLAEEMPVLRLGFFLGEDPRGYGEGLAFAAWDRCFDRVEADAEWAQWWLELGERTAEFHGLVDVQAVAIRRWWSRAGERPKVNVTVPVGELEAAADLDQYFAELCQELWQRIAAKCGWPAPPQRLP
ncbi:hypothetical protein E1263_11245 [Kribbella antibiotica]|uniref:Uncharacterized protein n=1 Tax=Kribbella antibiotica TaxID=190195 RepID=A0A4R4ZR16_9ACTN|nr:hypothetical protein [Kribbella antibiotica]TDD60349.1 hypothetical protein E1263_11245 [Kribbella antibiotica]